MLRRLFITKILDRYVRENFIRIDDFLRDEPLLKGKFEFYEISGSSGTQTFKHRLGYVPRDVIMTANTGSSFTFDYANFTKETIEVTGTGPFTARFFLGTYSEGATR